MKKICLSFLYFLFGYISIAQSDFILLKKNGHTVKTMFAGSPVTFTTSLRYHSGLINSIKNDSIHLLEYDVRQMPTNLGIYIMDTVANYHTLIYYKDILKIINEKNGFDAAASGASLFGGGLLITTIGLGTWIFTKSGERYHASPKLIIGSAVLGAAGYALLKTNSNSYTVGKKYQLNYIRTK
ncbi:MAG: hypothetical protein ABIM97_04945 [Ginsengibacter sp.]